MKILIIESIAATPHLETSGEIAIREKKKGNDVIFSWVGNNLPWNDWQLNWVYRFVGGSYEKKLNDFCNILEKKKINVENFDEKINLSKIEKWSKEFRGNLKQLKKYKYDGCNLGTSVASSLISKFRDINVDINKEISKVNPLLYSSALIYERAKNRINFIKPKKIFTFNNRFATTYPIIAAAEKFNIDILIHERGSDLNKFEIYKRDVHDINLIKKSIDKYWKLNEQKSKITNAKKFFLNKVSGKTFDKKNMINFTNNQIKNYLPKLPSDKRIVTFYSSRDYEKASIINQEFNQMKAFINLKKIISKFKDIHLVVRVHPTLKKNKSDDDTEWLAFKNKNTTIIQSFEKIDTYSLMFKSDIVITYTSSIIVEASYFNKPTICLGKFWWSGKNITEEPKNNLELKKMLQKNYKFKKKNINACLKIANYFLNYGIKFKYYKPINEVKGLFLGKLLSWKPYLILKTEEFIKKIKLQIL